MQLSLPPKVTNRAFERLAEINAQGSARALRIAVEGGGCSGFQYEINLENGADADDLVLEQDGQKVIDRQGIIAIFGNAVIDFNKKKLDRWHVLLIENPNATSSCAGGTSFSI
ncbi:UNVERIFIED_CONTAM: hypothetical protein GTU68_016790 [Idotea baltica]|nr:hypothetical protein [Idotea baltica]